MIIVKPSTDTPTHGTLEFKGKIYPCVLGRNGVVAEADKREGDGRTPAGTYKILRGFYRPDVLSAPETAGLEMVAIKPDMGWEDDSAKPTYNHFITQGYLAGQGESFQRNDQCYNLIFVLGHNGAWPYEGAPPAGYQANPELGSAIFMHVWRFDDEGKPVGTAGCVALAQDNLLEITKQLEDETKIQIQL